jgi:DNA-binding transcriptional MerR regulator
VTSFATYLNPSEAAERLGISPKALRLYEQRGLLLPVRTGAGWRTYGPHEMARAGEIAALRALGLSLAQVARVLAGEPGELEAALAQHQARLEGEIRRLAETVATVRGLRSGLVDGRPPQIRELARLTQPEAEIAVAFDLPWPWGGERFELRDLQPLTYIIGPLGSGKTRLARAIAENLPGAIFAGLDRADNDAVDARALLTADPALQDRVDRALSWLVEDGASRSPHLIVLLAVLEDDRPAALVVDMIEHGLDQASQQAVIAYLRRRGPERPPVLMLTRSCAILDLDAVGPGEAIILCPANHSMPMRVAPRPGAPGFEAVQTCLASPDVRARSEGVIAWRPKLA